MTNEEMRIKFEERRSEQKSLSYKALSVALIGMVASGFVPCRSKLVIYGIIIIYVSFVLYKSWQNWRCPACNRLLGDRLDIDSCPNCKTNFKQTKRDADD